MRHVPERWFTAGAAITFGAGLIGVALVPFTGMKNLPKPDIVSLWLLLMVVVGGCFVVVDVVRLTAQAHEQPILHLKTRYLRAPVFLGCVLTGVNLAFFGVIKPQLGQLVSFWADPLVADMDKLLLGSDAWHLTAWFPHPGMEQLYHQVWFVWVAVVLFAVLLREASQEKDRLLIGYFALWSIFGPLVHLMLPAAGPVFYDALGHGDRFAAFNQTAESSEVARYLWSGYVEKTFNTAGGISAMPSLHLATMFWTIIALRRSRLIWLAVALTTYIWIGSVAIGWHYMVDGLVGGLGAVLCYLLASDVRSATSGLPARSVH